MVVKRDEHHSRSVFSRPSGTGFEHRIWGFPNTHESKIAKREKCRTLTGLIRINIRNQQPEWRKVLLSEHKARGEYYADTEVLIRELRRAFRLAGYVHAQFCLFQSINTKVDASGIDGFVLLWKKPGSEPILIPLDTTVGHKAWHKMRFIPNWKYNESRHVCIVRVYSDGAQQDHFKHLAERLASLLQRNDEKGKNHLFPTLDADVMNGVDLPLLDVTVTPDQPHAEAIMANQYVMQMNSLRFEIKWGALYGAYFTETRNHDLLTNLHLYYAGLSGSFVVNILGKIDAPGKDDPDRWFSKNQKISIQKKAHGRWTCGTYTDSELTLRFNLICPSGSPIPSWKRNTWVNGEDDQDRATREAHTKRLAFAKQRLSEIESERPDADKGLAKDLADNAAWEIVELARIKQERAQRDEGAQKRYTETLARLAREEKENQAILESGTST